MDDLSTHIYSDLSREICKPSLHQTIACHALLHPQRYYQNSKSSLVHRHASCKIQLAIRWRFPDTAATPKHLEARVCVCVCVCVCVGWRAGHLLRLLWHSLCEDIVVGNELDGLPGDCRGY